MISHRSVMAAAGAAVRDSEAVRDYCIQHFGRGLSVHVGAYAQGVPGIEDAPFLWIVPQEENEAVNEDEVFTVRMTVGGAVKGSGGECGQHAHLLGEACNAEVLAILSRLHQFL